MNKLTNIIKQAVDLHYHIGPEIIPRKFNNVNELIINIKGKLGGVALKNHFYPTTPFIEEIKNKKEIKLIGSIVLNNYVGGLNPEAIYAASIISKDPIIVWFPTISANNYLDKTESEIAEEWVKKKNFKTRLSKNINGIYILNKSGNLIKKAVEVLNMIKKTSSILATGHISTNESKKLVEEATNIGINKIIVTHPIYQKINMPIEDQVYLVKKGAFIELCFSMYSIDKISISKIVYQIKKIGPINIILSSDVGQEFSPNPDIALYNFSKLLIKNGISLNMLETMLVYNPKKILS
jgi:hypothetical protein